MHLMIDWNDLRFFLAAVQAGTYLGAGEKLKVNRTTVGRRVDALESSLGISLFELTPSGYRPTAAGRDVLTSARRIDKEIEDLTARLSVAEQRLAGPLRVAAPIGLGPEFMPELMAFRAAYPDIKLELINASDPIASVTQRKAEIGICLTNQKPEHLQGVRVTELSRALYASRKYLKKFPTQLPLDNHQWIGWGKEMSNSDVARWMKANLPASATISAEVNSWNALKEAVLCGLGIGHIWCFLADRESRLVQIREQEPELSIGLWLLVHEDIPTNACTEAMVEFLVPLLAQRIGAPEPSPRLIK